MLMTDLEVAAIMEHGPGDAGELVGKRNGKLVRMQPSGRSLDPGFEAPTLPAHRFLQHHASGLHEERTQIFISALGDFAKNGAAPGGKLLGHDAEPSAEIAALQTYPRSRWWQPWHWK